MSDVRCRAAGDEMAAALTEGGGRTDGRSGGRLPGGAGDETAAQSQAAALQRARSAAEQLAARFRACAHVSQEPAAFARAAAVTAAAQALGQACMVIGGSRPAAAALFSGQETQPDLADQAEEEAQLLAGARLLAQAVTALASRTARAASDDDWPLPGSPAAVQASLRAASQHLAGVWEPAANGPPAADCLPPGPPAPGAGQ